ncbi:MAG: ribonuclease P protein component [Candidatus Pacebacteria bacterium]|nr:ribonuclease P protein component [Candidatus Paceibacterota bacterium]
MALPTKNRIKNKKDFDLVFKKGKAVNGSFLFIKSSPTERGYPRFGFIVAAKFAPKAVVRNKIRRIFSDMIHPKLLPNVPSCDTVVVVMKKVPVEISVLQEDFIAVLRKAGFS